MTSSSTKPDAPTEESATIRWASDTDKLPTAPSAWLARGSVLFYAFVLPFTHNAALKNAALLGMFVALVIAGTKRRSSVDPRSPIAVSVGVVMGLALLSCLASLDVAESLDAWRKHFVPMLLLFPLVVMYFRQRRMLLVLLAVLASAFGIRAALALYETATTTREASLFFKGYAMEATLYAPLLAGLVAAFAGRQRMAAGAVLLVALVASLASGSRTAAVAITLGCLVVPMALGLWRQSIVLVAAFALVIGGAFVAKPQLLERYSSALYDDSYIGPSGMSARYPIWVGTWQVVQRRPLLGYGFGWKKLGKTAVEVGLVDRWQASHDPYLQAASSYFSLPTDKVNPHNLVLQVLFEVGMVGFASYVVMLAILLWQALLLVRNVTPEWRPLPAIMIGFLASYLVMNVSNGLWIGAGPSTIMVALLEICRREANKVA